MFDIIHKQKEIDLSKDIISSCWISRKTNQKLIFNNYFEITKLPAGIWLSGGDRRLITELVSSIRNAKEVICLSTYIFSSIEIKDALIEASNRGVRVYLITASNKHLKSLPEEDDNFNKRMYQEMSLLFQEMQGIVKIRTSENFHTKFLIIDPNINELSKGYLLTANIDTKGLKGRKIDGKYRVNQEICVSLNKQEISDLFKQFCLGFWELSKEESKSDGFFPINHQFKQNYQFNSLLINSPNNKSLKNEIINLISKTKGNLYICTYGISNDNEIYDLIISELEKNRKIFILTRPRNSKMKDLVTLSHKGAVIYGHHDIHAKIVISEESNILLGLVMTANIEKINFESSFETGKILNPNQAKTILNVVKTWIKNFPLELKCNIKRSQLNEEVLVWDSIRENLVTKTVISEKVEDLESEYATSIFNYKNHEISHSKLKIPREDSEIFQKVIFKYIVKPPIKPVDAKLELENDKIEKIKPKKIKNNFSVFSLNGKKFLVVKNEDELKKAKTHAERYNAKIITLEKYIRRVE